MIRKGLSRYYVGRFIMEGLSAENYYLIKVSVFGRIKKAYRFKNHEVFRHALNYLNDGDKQKLRRIIELGSEEMQWKGRILNETFLNSKRITAFK